MEKRLTIGQLAKAAALSPKAIRYYEAKKLIPPATRTPANYRIYPLRTLTRLEFIQKAKAIGLSLDEIRELLDLSKQGQKCCNRVYAWSEHKIRELEEKIQFLKQLRQRLLKYQAQWQQQVPNANPSAICELIESVSLEEIFT